VPTDPQTRKLTTTGTATATASAPPLLVSNLFNTLPTLAGMAVSEIERESWFDGFLITAGVSQLIDDYLEPDPLSLRRATDFLAKEGGSIGRAVGIAVTRPSAIGIDRIAGARPSIGHVRQLKQVVDAGLQRLADLVIDPDIARADAAGLYDLTRCCGVISNSPARLPRALREAVVRLPSCFRSFDQHPEDLRQLARQFAASRPDRRQPLMVVGIRTSGSYLAPIYAAYLRGEGYAHVDVMTMRPGRPPHSSDRDRLRSVVARSGVVLVCDDPPGTGASIARVATELEGLGVPHASIVCLLALFGRPDELPATLRDYGSVLLGVDDWSIHRRMDAASVRDAVDRLFGPSRSVLTAERIRERHPRAGRGHLRAVFRLTVDDAHTGIRTEEYVSVEGVGLGYFGNHAIAVAGAVGEFLPEVIGVDDGLLFRTWMPESSRADRVSTRDRPAVALRIAEYVVARNRLLGLEHDVTLHQGGQYPAWEAASTLLSRSCGTAWPVGRTLVIDRAVKRLLRVRRPSVIDGRVELPQWFGEDGPDTMVKVDWDQGSSWNLGLGCCDPVFDLAGVTSASQDAPFARELRDAYEALQGEEIDEERWLLYQLAQLTARPDTRREERHVLRRACARAMQTYYRRVYFDDLVVDESGPLCGIDIDGVLETEHLGFPALTPVSAGALRALIAHGYRPVLATGRSLGDVIERCEAYRLAGGVAEYGTAAYVARDGRVSVLTTEHERLAIERLRSALRTSPGVGLDEDYTHAIRAFGRDARGTRGPVPQHAIATAGGADPDVVSLIVGDRQTDIVARSVDKGRAVRVLAAALADSDGPSPDPPLAFAIGDTGADVSLLELASRPFAPRHARQSLAAHGSVTRRPYQAGFADAVGEFLGHAPGSCTRCRLDNPSRERTLLLGLLGLREGGMARLPTRVLKLMVTVRTPEFSP